MRGVDLFEYQGKQYFASFEVPVVLGELSTHPREVREIADRIGYPVILKAQVTVGGRGKAGGIKLAYTPEDVAVYAPELFGLDIKGHVVERVLVEPASVIQSEFYASFLFDRRTRHYLFMLSRLGGVDIEEASRTRPEAIIREYLSPLESFMEFRADELVLRAKIHPDARYSVSNLLVKLYRCFVEGDADLVEVNPIARVHDREAIALDAKVTLDGNASFRHPEWEPFTTAEKLDPIEARARELGLKHIKLEGEIGIIGNGAGLVMSTLDVVDQAGGSAANFLDVGGGAGAEVLRNAIEVVNGDEDVRAVFINIFGGITRCDEVARGIQEALKTVEVRSPIVVRLDGTNAEEGRAVLAEIDHPFLHYVPTMVEAAQKAVQLAGKSSWESL